MKITYKILDNYDHLVSPPSGKLYPREDINILYAPEKIRTITLESYKQVEKLSKHLYDPDITQFAANIWHFCKKNFNYLQDDPNIDQYREPARSWKDKKIDCDCFTIFAGSLLLCAGFPCQAVMIGRFNDDFSHIYVGIGSHSNPDGSVSGGIAIDPVMELFNNHPDNITKSKIIPMKIERLADDLASSNHYIRGIGGLVSPVAAATARIIGLREKVVASVTKEGMYKNQIIAALRPYSDELSRLNFLISLNGVPEIQQVYGRLYPYIERIDSYGEVIFNDLPAVLGILIDNSELGKLKWSDLDPTNKSGKLRQAVDKLESNAKDLAKKVADAAKKVAEAVGEAAAKVAKAVWEAKKTEWQATVKVAKEAAHWFMKLNPVTLAARGAYLALLDLNVFNMAKKQSIGSGTLQEAKTRGYSSDNYKKISSKFVRVCELWERLGGEKENLISAINTGKNKKAIFPLGNKNIKGLGIVISSLLLEAGGIIAGVSAIYLDIKGAFKSDDKDKSDDPDSDSTTYPKTNSDGSITYEDGHIKYLDGDQWFPGPPSYLLKPNGTKITDPGQITKEQIDDSTAGKFYDSLPDDAKSGSSNTLYYVGGGVAALIFLALIFKK